MNLEPRILGSGLFLCRPMSHEYFPRPEISLVGENTEAVFTMLSKADNRADEIELKKILQTALNND